MTRIERVLMRLTDGWAWFWLAPGLVRYLWCLYCGRWGYAALSGFTWCCVLGILALNAHSRWVAQRLYLNKIRLSTRYGRFQT